MIGLTYYMKLLCSTLNFGLICLWSQYGFIVQDNVHTKNKLDSQKKFRCKTHNTLSKLISSLICSKERAHALNQCNLQTFILIGLHCSQFCLHIIDFNQLEFECQSVSKPWHLIPNQTNNAKHFDLSLVIIHKFSNHIPVC